MAKMHLKDLSSAELSKMIAETRDEMERRENIKQAEKEIKKTLEKFSVSLSDLGYKDNTHPTRRRSSKNLAPSKNKKRATNKTNPSDTSPKIRKDRADKRSTVSPKYKQPDGPNVWSGRGKTPAWVVDICNRENLSIEQFKSDAQFRIKK